MWLFPRFLWLLLHLLAIIILKRKPFPHYLFGYPQMQFIEERQKRCSGLFINTSFFKIMKWCSGNFLRCSIRSYFIEFIFLIYIYLFVHMWNCQFVDIYMFDVFQPIAFIIIFPPAFRSSDIWKNSKYSCVFRSY